MNQQPSCKKSVFTITSLVSVRKPNCFVGEKEKETGKKKQNKQKLLCKGSVLKMNKISYLDGNN